MTLRDELLKSIWHAFTALDVDKSGKVSKSQLKVSLSSRTNLLLLLFFLIYICIFLLIFEVLSVNASPHFWYVCLVFNAVRVSSSSLRTQGASVRLQQAAEAHLVVMGHKSNSQNKCPWENNHISRRKTLRRRFQFVSIHTFQLRNPQHKRDDRERFLQRNLFSSVRSAH